MRAAIKHAASSIAHAQPPIHTTIVLHIFRGKAQALRVFHPANHGASRRPSLQNSGLGFPEPANGEYAERRGYNQRGKRTCRRKCLQFWRSSMLWEIPKTYADAEQGAGVFFLVAPALLGVDVWLLGNDPTITYTRLILSSSV